MSSLKEEEPQLVVCSDRSISEREELESLRYQLKILKERLHVQALQAEQSGQTARLREENMRFRQRIEKMYPLLVEKEKALADQQLLVENFREAAAHMRAQLQSFQMRASQLGQAQEESASSCAKLQLQLQKQEASAAQLRAEFARESADKQQALEEAAALYAQFEHLKKRVLEAERSALMFQEKERRVLELERASLQTEQLLQESAAREAALGERTVKAESVCKELEEQLAYAHQHLAKKVRVATEAEDALKRMEEQVQEEASALLNAKEENAVLQKSVLEYQRQEMHHQNLLQAARESAQAVALESEEKCAKLYDGLKKAHVRIDELETIEEKYQQLHALWINMHGCFDLPAKAEDALLPLRKPYQNIF